MPVFLGFLLNTKTKQEFVAPTEADTRAHAEHNLTLQYPSPLYTLLTTYGRGEMDKILADVDRWPGLPSKLQPTTEQLLQNVSVRKGLPPLHQPKAQPAFDGARIEQVRQAVRDSSPEVQALAARLLAATSAPMPTPPMPTPPMPEGYQKANVYQPVAPRASASAYGRAAAPEPLPAAPIAASAKPAARPSLIDVLKAIR